MVNQTPAVGSIAQWNGTDSDGSAGHVAYVEVVTTSYIETTSDSYGGDTDRIRISRTSPYMPDNFIHFKDVTPTFTAATAPGYTWQGDSFSYAYKATYAQKYAVASGALPPGLTLSSAGVLSGVPSQPGTFAFKVRAINGASSAITATQTLVVFQPDSDGDGIPGGQTPPTGNVVGSDLPDIVGFASAGVSVAANTGSSFGSGATWIAGYGSNTAAGGWSVAKYPRFATDVNGNGRADIVGFGYSGVSVSLNQGSSFGTPSLVSTGFGYNSGWRVEKTPRVLVDVTGDGRPDIVGFSGTGVIVAVNNGDGSFGTPTLWTSSYSYNNGWRVDKNPRVVADVNGDGKADIVGFSNGGVYVSLSTGSGFAAANLVLTNFGYSAGGWRVDHHPRMLADVTGDGRPDIVGFANAGVYVAVNKGDGTFDAPTIWVAAYGQNSGGWRTWAHPRFVTDINGDGKADIVGFANAGVYVSVSTGSGFTAPTLALGAFGYSTGWRVQNHPRMVTDVTGDGRPDIVGFASAGVDVSVNNGDGTFAAPTLWTSGFGYTSGGWRVEYHPRYIG